MDKKQKLTPHQAVKQQMNRTKYEASVAVKEVQEAAKVAERDVRMTAAAGAGKNHNITQGFVEAARKERDRARAAAKAACELAIKQAKRAQLEFERAADQAFEKKRDELEAQTVENNKPLHAAYEAAKAEIMKEAENEIERIVLSLNEQLAPLNAQLKALDDKDAEIVAKLKAATAEAAAAVPAETPVEAPAAP